MPKALRAAILEQIKSIPKMFLLKELERKLKDGGVTGDIRAAAEAIGTHLMSGAENDFVRSDAVECDADVKIKVTEEDIARILDGVNEFLVDELPGLVHRIVSEQSKSQLKKAKRDWPEYYVWARGQQQIFKDGIELRWGRAMNLLRLMLSEVQQIGQMKLHALMRSKARKNIRKREVTLLLHIRACQTASEIITLLENGYADGAMARWRTLYELRVVAETIDKFGDSVAERYVDHEHVSRKWEMDNDLRHRTYHDGPSVDHEIQNTINAKFEAVVEEYGRSFATPYGWAAESLRHKKPTFRDLEAAIDLPELPPNYKMASYRVHAGVAGLFSGLGTLGDSAVPIAGASNAGLETPAINSAYTLVQFTGLLFGRITRMEDQIQVGALANLRDEVEKEFLIAGRKLARDESKLRRSSARS